MSFDKKMLRNTDWVFILLLLLLLVISTVVLSSASRNVVANQPFYYVQKHLIWICLGLMVTVSISFFDYHILEKLSWLFYGLALALLILVMFMPTQAGTHRWIDLGFTNLQPSEMAKIATVVVLARYFAVNQDRLSSWRCFIVPLVLAFIPMGLVFIEPDFGTSLAFFLIVLILMWVGGIPKKRMLALFLILFLIVGFVFGDLYIGTDGFTHKPENLPVPLPLENYQLLRIIIFINPDMDPLDSGYHILQSLVAIGSGGMWGKGYGQGSQVQGNFLPEHHTDFIFSVVGEEFGFAGALLLLSIYLFLLMRAVFIALRSRDLFGALLVTGIVAMFFFQVVVNVGMTIGLLPVTGLPLPFMSYGGTNMLLNLISVGIILSVNLRQQQNLF